MKYLLSLMLCLSSLSYASANNPKDKNDEIGAKTDIEFNNDNAGYLLNGTFIKSCIGIDMNAVKEMTFFNQKTISKTPQTFKPYVIKGIGAKNETMQINKELTAKNPAVIDGVPYTVFYNLVPTKDVKLVSLAQVKKEFCPKVTGPCLYMINKFFISNGVNSYKLDRDFIKNVEVLSSANIGFFKGQKPFTIIRIFTKTENNTYAGRIN
jgi:hypothetical protein